MLLILRFIFLSIVYHTFYGWFLRYPPLDQLPDYSLIKTRGGNSCTSPTTCCSQPKHQTAAASSARSNLLGPPFETPEELARGLDSCQTRDGREMAQRRIKLRNYAWSINFVLWGNKVSKKRQMGNELVWRAYIDLRLIAYIA